MIINDMKHLKTYNQLYEGLKDKMVGKSDDEIIPNIENLPPLKMLFVSTENGFLKGVIKAFKKSGGFEIGQLNYCLESASEHGHLDIVKYLVEKGANVNSDNDWPLKQACLNGHLDIVKYLVENGANVNSREGSGLSSAIYHGHLDIVKYLVENGVIINPSSILYTVSSKLDSIAKNQFDIVKYLIESLKKTNSFDNDQVHKYLLKALNVAKKFNFLDIYDYIKSQIETNEGLRDKMSPKTDDDIKESFSKFKVNEKTVGFKFIKNKTDLDISNLYLITNDVSFYKQVYNFFNNMVKTNPKKIFGEDNINDFYYYPDLEVCFYIEQYYGKTVGWFFDGKYIDDLIVFSKLNEGLRDKMSPKTDDEILKELGKLTDNEKIQKIFEYKLSYDLLPRDEDGWCIFNGDLNLSNSSITSLPTKLIVNGELDLSYNDLKELPNNLKVNGRLNLMNNNLTELPKGLEVKGDLLLLSNSVNVLPDDLIVKGTLYINHKFMSTVNKPTGVANITFG